MLIQLTKNLQGIFAKNPHLKGQNAKKLIILAHGYGASASDLAGLQDYLDSQKTADWAFIQAPHSVPIGPHTMGYGWFPIPLAQLQLWQTGQSALNFKNLNPEGLDKSANLLIEFLDQVVDSYDEIYFGGFSQGAIIGLHAYLKLQENVDLKQSLILSKIAGIIFMSGTYVHQEYWDQALKHLSHPKNIFWSHGHHDEVLSYGPSQELLEQLKSTHHSTLIESVSFSGGHEIPYDVLKGLKQFLHL